MGSILKILVDWSCEVYCDFELKGNAEPQSLFKLKLRKGTYMLDFKNNGELLLSLEYVMQSNEQEDLLKVPLKNIVEKKHREEVAKQIEKLNVSLEFHDKKSWIKNIENGEEIEIKHELERSHHYSTGFDECGLLLAYIGEQLEDGSMEKGSLFGCINKHGEVQIPFIYDWISRFSNNQTTVARLKGQIVFINKYGEIAFENVYSYVDRFIGNLCIVGKEGKKGVINEYGECIIPISFDDIEYDYIGDIQGYIVTQNGKKGVYGYDGIIKIPAIYDELERCREGGMVLATKDSKQCVFKDTGEIIIPMRYDSIKYDAWDLQGFILSNQGKMGFYDLKGSEIIPIQYDDIQKICRGHLLVTKDNKQGVYAENGKCIIEIKYDKCENTFCQTAYDYYIVTLNDKMGLLDDNGNSILAVEYERIKNLEGYLKLIYYKGRWHIYDVRQKMFRNNSQFHDYSEGWGRQIITELNIHQKHTTIYGLYDYDKGYLFLRTSDIIQKASNGRCYTVSKNGKKGLINDKGEWIYDTIYDDIDVREEVIVAKLKGNIVIYDYEGNVLHDKKYQIVPEVTNGLGWGDRGIHIKGWDVLFIAEPSIVQRNGKWGCINKDLWHINKKREIPLIKEYIPCIYDKIAYTDEEIVSTANLDKDYYIRYFVKKENNGNLHYYEYQLQNDVAVIKKDWVEPSEDLLYLFFDTETTGLPRNYDVVSSDTNNWPRLVQLSWLLTTSKGKILSKGNYIVKPQGFVIPKVSSDIHGISTQYAISHGTELQVVLKNFIADFVRASKIIGHNIDYDKKIIGAEMHRMGTTDIMDSKETICTMKSSVDLCKLQGSCGFKYPTLQELYKKLFNKDFDNAHDAESDILATMKCYFELLKRRIV